uniref:PPUP8120 n=1 Tax=Poeciliopsis prolifica TaxID=188132 RepID=A0A0S7ELX9_9TELE
MSAPPVGNFSLTFMFNFLSLSTSLIVSLYFSPSFSSHFLLVIQSASPLLFMNLTLLLLLPLQLLLSDAHVYKCAYFSHTQTAACAPQPPQSLLRENIIKPH